jgi:lipopolysaccharide/colanic/teichoic acid biosynthesis glycosyltransferase/GGDEF domain-containing protein
MGQISYLSKYSVQDQVEENNNSKVFRPLDHIAKRLLDILASFFGLILLSPIFLLVSILIKEDTPGPVFFKGKRLGKNGTVFDMWKFRTMFETQKSYDGPRITAKGDFRITPFGNWLRETKINELPQLINVLKGDMSLVGPRPEDVIVGNDWDEDAKKEILSIRPGITSPASIIYHNEESLLSNSNLMDDYFSNILPDKIRLDRLYVKNHSFFSDLDIIFWTLAIVFPKMVTEKIPEGYLFSGPIRSFITHYCSLLVLNLSSILLACLGLNLICGNEYNLIFSAPYLSFLVIIPAIVFSLFLIIFRLNRIDWANATKNETILLGLSSFLLLGSILISSTLPVQFHWKYYTDLPITIILILGFLSQAIFLFIRNIWPIFSCLSNLWLGVRQRTYDIGEKVIIVGAGKNFSALMMLLEQEDFKYIFNIVGVVDSNIPNKFGTKINGCQVLGAVNELPEILSKRKIDVIIFTTPKIPKKIKEFTEQLKNSNGIRLIYFDYLSRILNRQLTPSDDSTILKSTSENNFEFIAVHDDMTGLPNGIVFRDHLRKAFALGKRLNIQPKVMFITVDVNTADDAIEQRVWAEILHRVADRLQKMKRESDSLVFLGIYGFGFIFYNNLDETAVELIANRILHELSEPVVIKNITYHLVTKISITTEINEIGNVIDSNQDGILFDYLQSHQRIMGVVNG